MDNSADKVDESVYIKGYGTFKVEDAATLMLLTTKNINVKELDIKILSCNNTPPKRTKPKRLIFKTRWNKTYYNLPRIQVKLNKKTYVFTPDTIMGGGTYGIVVRYNTPKFKGFYWVIKVELSGTTVNTNQLLDGSGIKSSSDTTIIDNLNTNDIKCGQMEAKHLGKGLISYQKIAPKKRRRKLDWADFNLLEPMSGDLSSAKLRRFIDESTNFDKYKTVVAVLCIVEEVRKQIVCLLESTNYEGVYTDLKAANVLFTQTRDGDLEVKVGDLGSMTKNDDGEYISTYPCFPSNGGVFRLDTREQKEACLSWQLGVLLASLLGINIDDIYWEPFEVAADEELVYNNSEPYDRLIRDINYIADQMIVKLETVMTQEQAERLGNLLNTSPSERTSILEPLSQFDCT